MQKCLCSLVTFGYFLLSELILHISEVLLVCALVFSV